MSQALINYGLPEPVWGVILSYCTPWEAKKMVTAADQCEVLQVFAACYASPQKVVWNQWAIAYQMPVDNGDVQTRVITFFAGVIARTEAFCSQARSLPDNALVPYPGSPADMFDYDTLDRCADMHLDRPLWTTIHSGSVIDDVVKSGDAPVMRLFIDLSMQFGGHEKLIEKAGKAFPHLFKT